MKKVGFRGEKKDKGISKCGCGWSSVGGKRLSEHYIESHPRISKQGFMGDIDPIRDEKLRKFIIRKKKRF